MSRVKIVRRPSAYQDLKHITRQIASHNPDAAKRFVEAIDHTFQQLADMPEIGVLWESTHESLQDIRVWTLQPFPNYRLFYRLHKDRIEVLHIFHAAREIEPLLQANQSPTSKQ